MRIDVRLDRVSKRYRIAGDADEAPRGVAGALRRLVGRPRDFWALRDLSFEVARGETLGIVGRNGAGKSTILKLLSGITAPTAGRIEIDGRVSALIEVGSSFHPDLTGRENVFLNGALLGMRRAEIRAKLGNILDFAGIGDFVDTPVKRYSSGMYVRLGFSIAAHLEPDVLLLDEVLAVGDASFQAKCFRRIDELRAVGTTILFISHDLAAVEKLCERAILIDSGRLVCEGSPHDVTAQYQRRFGFVPLSEPDVDEREREAVAVRLRTLTALDAGGALVTSIATGDALRMRVAYEAREAVRDAVFDLFVYSSDGRLHCQYSTGFAGEPIDLAPGSGVVEFAVTELGLLPGTYAAQAAVRRRGVAGEIDWRLDGPPFRVDGGTRAIGQFFAPHTWSITHEDAAEAAEHAAQAETM